MLRGHLETMSMRTRELPDLSAATTPLDAALKLAEAGIPVFPAQPDKRPAYGLKWKDRATTDAEQLRRWFAGHDELLVGMPLAGINAVAIDVDDPGAVTAELSAILDGTAFNASRPNSQPGRGHYVFALDDDGWQPSNSAGSLPAGIDVRGSGGYIVAWGRRDSDAYAWGCRAVRTVPPGLRALLREARERTAADSADVEAFKARHAASPFPESMQEAHADGILRPLLDALPGERNNTAISRLWTPGKYGC
jgi:hypothetical protein